MYLNLKKINMKSKIHEHQKSNFKRVSKKLIIAALLVVGVCSFAQGQRRTPEERSKMQLERWTKELKLDDKQIEQIKPILAEQAVKNQAMRGEMMKSDKPKLGSAEERQASMDARKDERTAMENKMKAILTPEQFKKMKDMEEANRAKMQERMQERGDRGGNRDDNNGGGNNNGQE